jgi:multidrug efflux pump subunit AcrA (membrane-fusion protein)
MESIDDLLAQVKAELEPDQKNPPPKPTYFVTEADLRSPSITSADPPPYSSSSSFPSDKPTDNLLKQLQAEFAEQEQQETALQQQQIREEQKRQERELREAQFRERQERERQEQQLREQQLREQQKQDRKRQALKQEAEVWLKKLHPNTEEGRWFEEFSYNYPSKLEAAIDYLAALKETKAHP